MNKPNFFIIGAPKCGTTALSEYLRMHPDVRFAEPKEAKFFHTDFAPAHRYVHSLNEYLRCFGEGTEKYPAVGEGTVWYLYSSVAVKNILEFNPDAKFIVMVRHPVDLAYSLHSQLLYGGDEDVADFHEAWELQDRRSSGEDVPRFCRDAKSLQYGAVAKLGEQLQRLYQTVDREQVLVLFQEDFLKNPRDVYLRALKFLGLDDDGRTEFPKFNEAKKISSPRLAKVLYFGGAIKRALGIRGSLGVWKKLAPLLSKKAKRQPLSAEVQSTLWKYFEQDVALLSKLTGRDLSHWKR